MTGETCRCGTIGAAPELRQCAEHHRYWKGDKELISVTKIVKGTWPIKPDFSRAKPEVLEHARNRGILVDALFSAYVDGRLDTNPSVLNEYARRSTLHQQAAQLFFKVRRWWDEHKHHEFKSQVMLADDEVAGTCDVLDGGWIWDLKSTYNIEATYPIQVAAYAELHFKTFGEPVKGVGIIHISERFPEPKIIKLELAEVMQDWMIVRSMYQLVQRRTKGKALDEAEEKEA